MVQNQVYFLVTSFSNDFSLFIFRKGYECRKTRKLRSRRSLIVVKEHSLLTCFTKEKTEAWKDDSFNQIYCV